MATQEPNIVAAYAALYRVELLGSTALSPVSDAAILARFRNRRLVVSGQSEATRDGTVTLHKSAASGRSA